MEGGPPTRSLSAEGGRVEQLLLLDEDDRRVAEIAVALDLGLLGFVLDGGGDGDRAGDLVFGELAVEGDGGLVCSLTVGPAGELEFGVLELWGHGVGHEALGLVPGDLGVQDVVVLHLVVVADLESELPGSARSDPGGVLELTAQFGLHDVEGALVAACAQGEGHEASCHQRKFRVHAGSSSTRLGEVERPAWASRPRAAL